MLSRAVSCVNCGPELNLTRLMRGGLHGDHTSVVPACGHESCSPRMYRATVPGGEAGDGRDGDWAGTYSAADRRVRVFGSVSYGAGDPGIGGQGPDGPVERDGLLQRRQRVPDPAYPDGRGTAAPDTGECGVD